VLHVGQDVAVCVERYCYGRVPQHLGDDLWVHVLEQQYGRGGMAQLVERHRRETGTLEDRGEGPPAQVGRIYERTLTGAKDQAVLLQLSPALSICTPGATGAARAALVVA
jgi:hypothetical protein